MTTQFRNTIAEINMNALQSNFNEIIQIAGPDRFLCPMIKANAYGHGAIQVANSLAQVKKTPFGVALVEEALELRNAGIKEQIIVFGGFNSKSISQIIDADLIPIVSDFEQLELLNQKVSAKKDIHLKFNTGMNRLGFKKEHLSQVKKILKTNSFLSLTGVLTHFHSSHLLNEKNSTSYVQLLDFSHICDELKEFDFIPHVMNSDAITCFKNQRHSIMTEKKWGFRPGIMLYGYVSSNLKEQIKLTPVMTLKSVIQALQKVKKGDSVSYNAQWVAEQDSLIGILGIGYADGLHRHLSHRGQVKVCDQVVPLVGNICMDFTMVDLTHIKSSRSLLNEEVILFGADLGADVLAQKAETISYEILTSVGSRVPRIYKQLR